VAAPTSASSWGKLRWRDKVRRDLKAFQIDETGWYTLAQDREEWCKA